MGVGRSTRWPIWTSVARAGGDGLESGWSKAMTRSSDSRSGASADGKRRGGSTMEKRMDPREMTARAALLTALFAWVASRPARGQVIDAIGQEFLSWQAVFDTDFVPIAIRSEEHTSELQSLMRISYAVFCLKKKKTN